MTRGCQYYATYQTFSNKDTPKVSLKGEADILTGSKRVTAFNKKLTLQRLFWKQMFGNVSTEKNLL